MIHELIHELEQASLSLRDDLDKDVGDAYGDSLALLDRARRLIRHNIAEIKSLREQVEQANRLLDQIGVGGTFSPI